MIIKELNIDTMSDWFDFFEKRAFLDHEEWNGCYCTAYYYPKPKEYANQTDRRKDYAKWLIETGRMKGYLAYADEEVVGWVNVNEKKYFPRLEDIYIGSEKVLSIVCFIVQKDYRRKGIAKQLLARIVEDAKERDYLVIEAYPKKRSKSEYGKWNGPYEMYIKSGFVDCKIGKVNVVRKNIKVN
jgi:GNAT superfamily N-acetyltransferase